MTANDIYAKIDNGERLTDKEVAFAHKHGVILWGSVNYAEHQASLPDYSSMPCLPEWSDEEFAKYQKLTRSFN